MSETLNTANANPDFMDNPDFVDNSGWQNLADDYAAAWRAQPTEPPEPVENKPRISLEKLPHPRKVRPRPVSPTSNEKNKFSSRVSLEKPIVYSRGKNGQITATIGALTKTLYSLFDRYEKQLSTAEEMMREAYNRNTPLKVLDIGVAQGQEPLDYIQKAANIAGADKIADVLDLELVEYMSAIPIIDSKQLPNYISPASRAYLSELYEDKTKAHFDTPFQDYVKTSEAAKRNAKFDVVLFNNVIQHASSGKKDTLEAMQNLANIVSDNGILCMTCEPLVISKNPELADLLEQTKKILAESGFEEAPGGIYRKTGPYPPESSSLAQAQQ